MASRYSHSKVGILKSPFSITTGTTQSPITSGVTLKKLDASDITCMFKLSNVTIGAGDSVEIYMQELFDDEEWLDLGPVASVEIIGNGYYWIKLSKDVPIEALVLPLSSVIRFVYKSTLGTSTITIDDIYVGRESI